MQHIFQWCHRMMLLGFSFQFIFLVSKPFFSASIQWITIKKVRRHLFHVQKISWPDLHMKLCCALKVGCIDWTFLCASVELYQQKNWLLISFQTLYTHCMKTNSLLIKVLSHIPGSSMLSSLHCTKSSPNYAWN